MLLSGRLIWKCSAERNMMGADFTVYGWFLTREDVQGGPRKKRVVILLSANRSQTIGVLLSHLKMPHEDFRRAITALDTRTLQPNFVVQLMKLLPTDQEVAALQSYTGPKEELGTAERFLFELLCIPRLKPRLQCFVFILEFNARLHDLSENVEVFSYAVHDIKRCTKLLKVVEIVLAIGNYLNGTGPKGGAYGFKLEVLTKLADTKTSDNKSTLLHYLVASIERKFPELIDFPQELSNVEIGSKVSENMVDEISKFKKEIKFIYEEMNKPYYKSNAKNDPCGGKLEQFYHTAYNDMEVILGTCMPRVAYFVRMPVCDFTGRQVSTRLENRLTMFCARSTVRIEADSCALRSLSKTRRKL
jgi:hypothetical protein